MVLASWEVYLNTTEGTKTHGQVLSFIFWSFWIINKAKVEVLVSLNMWLYFNSILHKIVAFLSLEITIYKKHLLCMMHKWLDFKRTHFKKSDFPLTETNFPRSLNHVWVFCKICIFDICGTDCYLYWLMSSIFFFNGTA